MLKKEKLPVLYLSRKMRLHMDVYTRLKVIMMRMQ